MQLYIKTDRSTESISEHSHLFTPNSLLNSLTAAARSNMSSSRASVCLLVLLGAVLAAGSPLHFLSDKLRQNHRSIAQVLELTQSDIVTRPLFTPVIQSLNASCPRRDMMQLMNATLDVYTRIFSSILQHEPGTILHEVPESKQPDVEAKLRELQRMMERLRRGLYHETEDTIGYLNNIKVDSPAVQRKALAEFKEVFQAASVVGHRCGHAHSSAK